MELTGPNGALTGHPADEGAEAVPVGLAAHEHDPAQTGRLVGGAQHHLPRPQARPCPVCAHPTPGRGAAPGGGGVGPRPHPDAGGHRHRLVPGTGDDGEDNGSATIMGTSRWSSAAGPAPGPGAGRVFTCARLLSGVGGHDCYGGARTVDVHVQRLRAGPRADHEHLITTVHDVGCSSTTTPPRMSRAPPPSARRKATTGPTRAGPTEDETSGPAAPADLCTVRFSMLRRARCSAARAAPTELISTALCGGEVTLGPPSVQWVRASPTVGSVVLAGVDGLAHSTDGRTRRWPPPRTTDSTTTPSR